MVFVGNLSINAQNSSTEKQGLYFENKFLATTISDSKHTIEEHKCGIHLPMGYHQGTFFICALMIFSAKFFKS